MNSVVVRRAAKADAEKIAEFATKLVDQHIAYDRVRFSKIATPERMARFYGEQTEIDNTAVFVAELDDRIVGFAYVGFEQISYQDLATDSAWIHDIYLDESARHAGAGQQLIEAAVKFAREHGATKVLLWVADRNTLAKDFFEKAGFKTTMHEMMLVVSG